MNRFKKYNELESRILRSAKKLFILKGYSNITNEMIAEESGATKTNVTWHFRGREKLLECLTEDLLQFRESLLEKIIKDTDDAMLAYVIELVTFQRLCDTNEIAKDLFINAYRTIPILDTIRKWAGFVKKHYWDKQYPDISLEDYEAKEYIASNLEFAALSFSKTPECPFEDRMSLVLNSYLELYFPDEQMRKDIIEKALVSDYLTAAQKMFVAMAEDEQ